MHRYILFAGDNRNPIGGYDDYIGSRKSIESLKKLALECHVGGHNELPSWADIVDVTTMGRLWTITDGEWVEDDALPFVSIETRYELLYPTKYYKYYGGFGQDNRNLQAITDAQLWYQKPSLFNDPFDSAPAIKERSFADGMRIAKNLSENNELYVDDADILTNDRTKGVRKITEDDLPEIAKYFCDPKNVKFLADNVYDSFGVCCFSRSPVNILMWSHYGKDHTGYVLEFDISEFDGSRVLGGADVSGNYDLLPRVVEYSDNRPIIEDQAKCLSMKSLQWEYEKEVRVLQPEGNGSYPYNRNVLKSVIMGCRASEKSISVMEKTLEDVKSKYGQHVDLHHCKLHDTEFKVYVEGRPDLVDDD